MTELPRRPVAVVDDRGAAVHDLYTAPMEAVGVSVSGCSAVPAAEAGPWPAGTWRVFAVSALRAFPEDSHCGAALTGWFTRIGRVVTLSFRSSACWAFIETSRFVALFRQDSRRSWQVKAHPPAGGGSDVRDGLVWRDERLGVAAHGRVVGGFLAVVVWAITRLFPRSRSRPSGHQDAVQHDAADLLDRRFASGEIDEDTYRRIRGDVTATR